MRLRRRKMNIFKNNPMLVLYYFRVPREKIQRNIVLIYKKALKIKDKT